MLTHISIHNFQSHEKTEIDLGKVNGFIGRSDRGKTAVLRALYWLAFNLPAGEAFRSKWGGDTSVCVTTDDGHNVTRFRSNKENYYEVDGVRLKAVGQSVPSEVTAALRLGPFNFQRQLDAPYLLTESSGEVARQLNSIVSLDMIDSALSGINQKHRSVSQEMATVQSSIADLEASLVTYAEVSKLDGFVRGLEMRSAELERKQKAFKAITMIVTQHHSQQTSLEIHADYLKKVGRTFTEIEGNNSRLAQATRQYNTLCRLVEDVKEARAERVRCNDVISRLTSPLNTLKTSLGSLQHLKNRSTTLTYILSRVKEAKLQAEESSEALRAFKTEYETLKPDVCPMCGRGGWKA